jgi:hypothetical protein
LALTSSGGSGGGAFDGCFTLGLLALLALSRFRVGGRRGRGLR